MSYKSVGKPVVITPENMERFAAAVSRPKPMVTPDHPIRRVDRPRKLGTARDEAVELTLLLSEQEADLLRCAAGACGQDLADYLRDAALARARETRTPDSQG